MKTKPTRHQWAALEAAKIMLGASYTPDRAMTAFALLMDMGTGKTKVGIDIAEVLHNEYLIDALIVVAPNGVHSNWVVNEIPKHLDERVDRCVLAWGKAHGTKKFQKALKEVTQPKGALDVFTINYEALIRGKGQEALREFLKTHRRFMLVVDESVRIKNHKSQTFEWVNKLGKLAAYKYIMTGYPIPQGVLDFYAQFSFLGSNILGFSTYAAYKAHHAVLVDKSDPAFLGLVKKQFLGGLSAPQIHKALQAVRGDLPTQEISGSIRRILYKVEAMRPVAKDRLNNPIYRNVDQLIERIRPYSFTVRKRDVLDLPPKVFEKRGFELTSAQRKLYKDVADKPLSEVVDENGMFHEVRAQAQITKLMKWMQISGGFVYSSTTPVLFKDNPKLKLLLSILEEFNAPVIIYAWFRPELSLIQREIRRVSGRLCRIIGADNDKAEDANDFQEGVYDIAIGQTRAAGIGLTLTRAEVVIYYSHNYDSDVRQQSEDRAHRIGLTHSVTYIDLVGEGTQDRNVLDALARKRAVSDEVLDKLCWR